MGCDLLRLLCSTMRLCRHVDHSVRTRNGLTQEQIARRMLLAPCYLQALRKVGCRAMLHRHFENSAATHVYAVLPVRESDGSESNAHQDVSHNVCFLRSN